MSGPEPSGKPFPEQQHFHAHAPHRAALLTYPHNFQKALKDAKADKNKVMFGAGQGIPSVFVSKLIAQAKMDFVFLDVEHGMYDRLTLHDCIHAVNHHSEGRTGVLVRVPKHDEISLTTALDAGAAGIIIPHTESAADVKEFINKAYYPPIGHRSFSPWNFTPGVHDASLYPNDPFNVVSSNKHVALIPQIESVKGIENLDEIASIPGVHALMFGPGDFLLDAREPLTFNPPPARLGEAMGAMKAAGDKYNIPLLGAAQQLEQVPHMLEGGFGIICVVFDVWSFSQMSASNYTKAVEFRSAYANKGSNGAAKASNGAANGTTGVGGGAALATEQQLPGR